MNKRITTIADLVVLVQNEFAEMGNRLNRLELRMDALETRMDIMEKKAVDFATKDDLKQFATKDDLKQFATKDDLKRFATKDDLKESTEMLQKEIRNIDMRTPVIDLQVRMKSAEERLDTAGI